MEAMQVMMVVVVVLVALLMVFLIVDICCNLEGGPFISAWVLVHMCCFTGPPRM